LVRFGLGLVLGFGSFKDHPPAWTYVMVALVLLLTWLVPIFTMCERQDAARFQRRDAKRSPKDVLGWVHGIWCEPAELDRLFTLRADRRFDRYGYLRFWRWRMYGERSVAGQHGAAWLFGETVTLTYEDETLAQYQMSMNRTDGISRH
jgi:hypothetical protein